jgi:hypothetical protein
VTEVIVGGLPVTKVPSGGMAVVYTAAQGSTAPVPQLAAASGSPTVITITFSGPLKTTLAPAPTDFVVKQGGVSKPIASFAFGATRKITLTMDAAYSRPLTVSYTPGANPLQGMSGKTVSAFTNYPVT